MYNVHQFANKMQQQGAEAKRQLQQQQYHLKHEQYKKQAYINLKKKSDEFLKRELTSSNPVVIEDDHFQSWRKHRIFRDVCDQDKFIGSKMFKHRPNEDMGKYYEQRERREMSYLASKTEDLVKKGLVHQEHISRSLASQGPYKPKIQFRTFKKDGECLQPRLRYSSITDEEKLKESDMLFDERLQSIYQKFQAKKLKTGKQVKSNIYNLPSEPSYAISSNSMRTTKSMSIRKGPSIASADQPEIKSLSSSQMSGSSKNKPKTKTYFKLAQMMEMFHPEHERREELTSLLQKSQFSRRKDLTNIRSNSYNQNYQKHPVL